MFEERSYHSRRLPIYLLLDTSASMAGDPIGGVHEGLGLIYRTLSADPQTVETAYLGIIHFGNRAVMADLVPIDEFVPPALDTDAPPPNRRAFLFGPFAARRAKTEDLTPSCALGAALHLLIDSIQNDLVANTPGRSGDYRPLVFVLTGSRPTDNWREEVPRLRALRGNYRPSVVALAVGGGADAGALSEITDNVFLLQNMSPEAIRSFFRWMSGSIARSSNVVSGSPTTEMRPPPPGLYYNPD